MPITFSFGSEEWNRFAVPHSMRLVGEEQHLIGAGFISVATNLRLQVAVEEAEGEFLLRLGGGPRDQDGRCQHAEPSPATLCERWQSALQEVVALEPSALGRLEIEVDFGPLWQMCPHEVLAVSPALAVALTVAALAHGAEGEQVSEHQLAETASRLCERLAMSGHAEGGGCRGRFYGDALLSVTGGASYVEPGRDRLNVQQLVPPQSLLLVMAPGLGGAGRPHLLDGVVAGAAAKVRSQGHDIGQTGDAAFEALFELAGSVLSEQEVTMLYGLMRVRQMAEAFLECLGEPLVDNDRLAEVCDEESAILGDYFAFPAAPYGKVRAAAGGAGALGTKLTWGFGGYPAAIVVAPGRRAEVGEALSRRFPDLYCILTDVEPDGLVVGEGAGFESPR